MPVYRSGSTWLRATAETAESLASHVIIGSNQDWVLAVSSGEYEFPDHGFSTGLYYTADPVITQTPTGPYEDPVLEITSTSSVRVIAFMPAIRRAVTEADATNINVASTEFVGNLSSTDTDVQTALQTIDGLVLGGADVSDWAASTTYHAGDIVRFNGMPFYASVEHASSSTFGADLSKWRSFYGFAIVANQAGHGFARWKPIYWSGTAWAAADSNVAATLATHVVLEVATDWILAVNQGIYTYPSHGLGTGVKYLNGVNISPVPSSYENAVYSGLDSDRVEVLTYLPAIHRSDSDTLLSDFEMVGRVTVTNGVVNQTVSWTKSYSWLKVVTQVRSTSTPYNLWLRLNGDATGANYPGHYLLGTGTTVSYGVNVDTLAGIPIATTIGGNVTNNNSTSEAMIFVKNTGVYKTWQLQGGHLSSAPALVSLIRFGSWTNTADNVTSVQVILDEGAISSTYCDVLIYGKV